MQRKIRSLGQLVPNLLILGVLSFLASCDGGDLEAQNQTLFGLDDGASNVLMNDVMTLSLADWTGVSSTGDSVQVDINFEADLPVQWFEKSKILLRVQLLPLDQNSLNQDTLNQDTPYSARSIEVVAGPNSGSLNMTIPTSNEPFTIAADIYQPRTDRVMARTRSVAALDVDLLEDPENQLPVGGLLVPEIVPQSYSRQQVGERMIHRFAVRVFDAEEHIPGRRTLHGLGVEPEQYFTALENGIPDVESPITVDATRQRLQIYFVLDASYSIVLADATRTLKRAASRSVMALNTVADYDYRQFSGYIRSLNQIDDIHFDDATSATALYYALDGVLQDIDTHADPLAHKIIVAFTDGRDYASINQYPDISTYEGMLQHATGLIRQARERESSEGGGLELHIVSVGDADIDALNRLAASGAGVHVSAGQWSGVGNAFEDVTRHVLSTYFLEYNSQRTALPTQLELEVHVGNAKASVPIN